mgnify:CR=1 FL=1
MQTVRRRDDLPEEHLAVLRERRRLQLELRDHAGGHRRLQAGRGEPAEDPVREVQGWVVILERGLLQPLADQVLHHERQAAPRLGTVRQHGDHQRVHLPAPAHRQRLLQNGYHRLIISNLGHFYYSVKAFDILERFDGENEYEDALKGGVVGLFQMVIAGKASLDQLQEAVEILKNDIPNNPQVELLIKIINKWLKENDP